MDRVFMPFICVIDDDAEYGRALCESLLTVGYNVRSFPSASEFMRLRGAWKDCDLVISDLSMPGISGLELCEALRAEKSLGRIPIILVTGSEPQERVRGLEAGADDFVTKPYEWTDLLAKVRSLLAIRSAEVETLEELKTSRGLNDKLTTDLQSESKRSAQLVRLQRFLSPNLAHVLTQETSPSVLRPHRAEVTVLFVDLRRFTPFSEKHEPEDVLEVLSEYYTAVGMAAVKHRGTLGHLAGDGIMVFFNDPEPVENHREVAVRMALEAREVLATSRRLWREREYDIDIGFGLSSGYATIGEIGFERFSQYSVIGTVTNIASRLCQAAGDGQILASHRFVSSLRGCICDAEGIGEVNLKGIEKPVSVYNIHSLEDAPKKPE